MLQTDKKKTVRFSLDVVNVSSIPTKVVGVIRILKKCPLGSDNFGFNISALFLVYMYVKFTQFSHCFHIVIKYHYLMHILQISSLNCHTSYLLISKLIIYQ